MCSRNVRPTENKSPQCRETPARLRELSGRSNGLRTLSYPRPTRFRSSLWCEFVAERRSPRFVCIKDTSLHSCKEFILKKLSRSTNLIKKMLEREIKNSITFCSDQIEELIGILHIFYSAGYLFAFNINPFPVRQKDTNLLIDSTK